MSIAALNYVLNESQATGSARLVLIAVADDVNGDTGYAWPSVRTIARKARLSESTARRALAELVLLGELRNLGPVTDGVLEQLGGRYIPADKRPNLYQLTAAVTTCQLDTPPSQTPQNDTAHEPTTLQSDTSRGVKTDPRGVSKIAARGVIAMTPNPSTNPRTNPRAPQTENASPSARRPATPISGALPDPPQIATALAALIDGYRLDYAATHAGRPPPAALEGTVRKATRRELRYLANSSLDFDEVVNDLARVLGVCAKENKTCVAHLLADFHTQPLTEVQ